LYKAPANIKALKNTKVSFGNNRLICLFSNGMNAKNHLVLVNYTLVYSKYRFKWVHNECACNHNSPNT